MIAQRLTNFTIAFVMSIASLLVLAVPTAHAATSTLFWCATANGAFNSAANWNTNADCASGTSRVPTNGDVLGFDASKAASGGLVINNDISNLSLGGINFSGEGSGIASYSINGNDLTITGDIIDTTLEGNILNLNLVLGAPISISGLITVGIVSEARTLNIGSHNLTLNTTADDCLLQTIHSVISGTGAITKTGAAQTFLDGVNTYTGATTVSAGSIAISEVTGFGAATAGTTVASGAFIALPVGLGEDATVAEPLTVGGTGIASEGAIKDLKNGCSGGGSPTELPTITLSGAITLTANTTVSLALHDLKITGALSGDYTIAVRQGSTGVLTIASSSNTSGTSNGNVEAQPFTTEYKADSSTTNISVASKETAVVTGKYGSITVFDGGTLKGTGTVGSLVLNDGAVLAPGLSPGCLTSGNLQFDTGSTYQFEVGGTTACTEYDQTVVTGTVSLGDGTLSVIRFNDFKPAANQTYTIISNDASDAVTGTFSGLAEGATFTVDGYVFKISYVGGDGNDVVLTVQSVPSVPDTGLRLIKSNPLASFAITSALAAGLWMVSRKQIRVPAKKR